MEYTGGFNGRGGGGGHKSFGEGGVVVKWISRWTVDHRVRGSIPAAALMSFGKTLIYICHPPPRC